MTFFFQRTSCFLHFVAHSPHKNPLLSRQKYSPLSFAFNFFYPICLPQIVYSLTKETLPLLFKVVLCHVLQVLLNFSTLGFDSICLGFKIFYIRRLYLQIQVPISLFVSIAVKKNKKSNIERSILQYRIFWTFLCDQRICDCDL